MDADTVYRRPGLPLDPLLQLFAGELQTLPVVTWTGGPSDPVAPADPMRVALYVTTILGASQWAIGPPPSVAVVAGGGASGAVPVVIHCRDYPGLVQGEWVGNGMVGTQVAVFAYRLSSRWGV